MATFLGKALLIAGLGFEAYTLYSHSETISKFNVNYERGLRKLSANSQHINLLTDKETIVRLTIVALYALSLLLLATKSKFIKLLVLIGVILNTLLLANPYLDKSQNAHFLLLQNLGIIGGLFYLLGEKPEIKAPIPPQKQVSRSSSNDLSSSSNVTNSKKDDNKQNKKKK